MKYQKIHLKYWEELRYTTTKSRQNLLIVGNREGYNEEGVRERKRRRF